MRGQPQTIADPDYGKNVLAGAAVALRVEPDDVLASLAAQFDGRGAALIEWDRELPGTELWSRIDPGEQRPQR